VSDAPSVDRRTLYGIDRDAAGERPEFDPSIAAIIGPYSGMLNDYVRNDLKFDSDLPYEVLTSRVRRGIRARMKSIRNVARRCAGP